MKTTINLDYQAILANQPQPIHFALLFEAPESTLTRPQPAAFTIVLDRSTSMTGEPIDAARQAAKDVVKNLRKTDLFSLVVFDNESRTIIPLAKVADRKAAAAAIDAMIPPSLCPISPIRFGSIFAWDRRNATPSRASWA